MLLVGSLGPTWGQVSGVVYRDFNANGTRDNNNELGVGGVTVTLYNSSGVAGSTTTSLAPAALGQYTLTPSGVGPYRVQFSNLPAGYVSGPHGSQSGTSVQFISNATQANVNFGVNYPADYCEDAPMLAVACYVNGDPTSSSSTNGNNPANADALITFPYTASGIISKGGTAPSKEITAGKVGAVWGLTYQPATQTLFSASVVKRHAGFGPLGIGGIYKTNIQTGLTTNYIDLNTIGINVGALARPGLPADRTQASQDASAYDAVGKVGIGGIDLSEDGKTLYLVNLNDRKLYAIGNIDPTTTPSPADVRSFTIPDPDCSGGNLRPWAVKVYRNKVYVGVVCSAEGSQLAADLKATVYEFNPATGLFATTPTLQFPLNYTKGPVDLDGTCATPSNSNWHPWVSDFSSLSACQSNFYIYPQPILSAIEFDANGALIMAFLDRNSMQIGYENLPPVGTNLINTIVGGDILRAFINSNGTYQLENNGVADGLVSGGQGNNQGPGGGEFYVGDEWTPVGDYHGETSNGGLAFKPGSGEVVMSATNPLNSSIRAGGIKVLSNTTGAAQRGYALYNDIGAVTFGKATGIGDPALLCGPAPIEIGNRIWNDGSLQTANGIQDEGASGLAGITVRLFNAGNLVASTVSDANGEYYFNQTNVPGGLLPNTRYDIRIALGQAALANFSLTKTKEGTDHTIDSDAVVVGDSAVIALTTGNYGQNDHSYDIGFASCPPAPCIPVTILKRSAQSLSK